jgi:CoA-transferase family III
MNITGDPSGPPQRAKVYTGDYITALTGWAATMMALWEVKKSGCGQVVDLVTTAMRSEALPDLPTVGVFAPLLRVGRTPANFDLQVAADGPPPSRRLRNASMPTTCKVGRGRWNFLIS